jgi:8-amino-3,8-dideoxy-alpha-D-manno-octulosonate transaminase
MLNRRQFLAVAASGVTLAQPVSKLSEDGGRPVRDKPLKADYWGTQFYDAKELQQLTEVHSSRQPFRWYGPGNQPPLKVATFEKEWASRMQTRFALAVTSGTSALQTALAALQIGPGDEVILPAWTWHSCFNSIVLAGALPVFVEIDESFNIDPADVESKITPQTKVIMAVHLQGNPCDMDRIMSVASKHQLKVLEDCAQSVGGSYKGRPLGSIGHIGIYSLQLNKTITAGEGGAVVTSDPILFERAARFHDLGALRPGHEKVLGQSKLDWFIAPHYRLNEFSGGVLLAQARKLDTIVEAVRSNARRVYEGIRDLPGLHLRHLPDPEGELGSAVFLGFSTKEQCERYMALMKKENVPAHRPAGSVILPIVPHIEKKITLHPAWPSFTTERGKSIRYGAACCPRTIDILARFAGVPLDPKFSQQDTDDIVAAIRKVYPIIT